MTRLASVALIAALPAVAGCVRLCPEPRPAHRGAGSGVLREAEPRRRCSPTMVPGVELCEVYE